MSRLAIRPGRYWLPALTGLLLAAVAGCGGGTGSLSGKVTFNGKPVTSGTVQVFLPTGATLTSEIAPDGSYAINDIPTGTVKIGVSSPNPKKRYEELLGFAKTEEQRKQLRPPDPELLKSWVALPDAAAQPDTSGLTATIKSGPNSQDLTVTGTASPPTPGSGGPVLPSRGGAKKG